MPDGPNRTLAPIALLAVAATLALAGCGDEEGAGEGAVTGSTVSTAPVGDGSTDAGSTGTEPEDAPAQGPTDTEQVRRAIEAFLVSPESETVCNELVTANLLRKAYGDLQGCLDGRGGPTLAATARIDELEISGAKATATAVPKGGVYADSDVDFTVVEDGGAWRIDTVEADIPVGP